MMNRGKRFFGPILTGASTGAVMCVALVALQGCLPTSNTRWEEDRSIPFSPDDRAIAYQHKGSIYVARTQGDEHRRIFESTADAIVSTPHWAPGQRAVLFAVSNGEQDAETGLLDYELWFWPAPESIWASAADDAEGDTVELPVDWEPLAPRKLLTAQCRHAVQIKADALFAWHPDGNQVLFLDTDETGRQTVHTFDVNKPERAVAAPFDARSLAFSVSPQGDRLHVAVADAEKTELWLGPLGAARKAWRQIEINPGPRNIPALALDDEPEAGDQAMLYDLRPRLGVWSPDSQWLAHTRIAATIPEGMTDTRFHLVITPVTGDQPQRSVAMSGTRVKDLHWRPGGRQVALLSDKQLLVVNADSGTVIPLSGVLGAEKFVGWSAPGNHMAYVVQAEKFRVTTALLPTGHRLNWAPAERHKLMVAEPDGSLPGNRFGLMNISAARWGEQSEKLSFWATYLPTVSLLPPGDPAAVLDLNKDAIRWYPTDIAEYAHVGHYYVLNAEFDEAITQYSDALNKVGQQEREQNPMLESWIHLWRGVARRASGNQDDAELDFDDYRKALVLPSPDEDAPEPEDAPVWDESVLRNLTADRDILSTMLSMGHVQLAIDYADSIVAADADARRVQALCYAALIDASLGQRQQLTEGIVSQLIPAALDSTQIPETLAQQLVRHYLDVVADPANQRQLLAQDKRRFGAMLAALADTTRTTRPEQSLQLRRTAVVFYREAGDMEMELDLLRVVAAR
jgi:Tol biopolymer transport system component